MTAQPDKRRTELRVERARRYLSQEAAAEAMGFSRAIVIRAEKGESIRLEHAQQIAQFYGRPFEELFPLPEEAAA
jgi:transcriptional regulator with XRE-family HTH domain